MFTKYYIQSPELYFHHSQFYDRATDLYLIHNQAVLSPEMLKNIFDSFSGNLPLTQELNIGKHPRKGMQHPEDYDSQAWYPIIYEVFVLDDNHLHNINGQRSTPISNLVIHKVYFGYSTPQPYYPTSYSSIISKHNHQGLFNGIRALFYDYLHPKYGWLLTFHWKRGGSNTPAAKLIQQNLPNDLQDGYDFLLNIRRERYDDKDFNRNGSFACRLDFALALLGNERYKCELYTQQPAKKRFLPESADSILDVSMS